MLPMEIDIVFDEDLSSSSKSAYGEKFSDSMHTREAQFDDR